MPSRRHNRAYGNKRYRDELSALVAAAADSELHRPAVRIFQACPQSGLEMLTGRAGRRAAAFAYRPSRA